MRIQIPQNLIKRIEKIADTKGVSIQEAANELTEAALTKTIASVVDERDTFVSFTTSACVKAKAASVAREKGISLSLYIHEILAKEVSADE